MEALQAELAERAPKTAVCICVADLSTLDGQKAVSQWVRENGFKPNVLINNAGLGDYGSFVSADMARIREQLEVNIAAVVQLCHDLTPLMARPAGILNVGSFSVELPLPDLAVYAATKAFVTSFSEALAVELAAEGVAVSCVCPGPTPTSFGATARRPGGRDTNRAGQEFLKQPPQKVVQAGLYALETGRARVFPGFSVALAALVFRLLPRPLLRWLLRRRYQAGG